MSTPSTSLEVHCPFCGTVKAVPAYTHWMRARCSYMNCSKEFYIVREIKFVATTEPPPFEGLSVMTVDIHGKTSIRPPTNADEIEEPGRQQHVRIS